MPLSLRFAAVPPASQSLHSPASTPRVYTLQPAPRSPRRSALRTQSSPALLPPPLETRPFLQTPPATPAPPPSRDNVPTPPPPTVQSRDRAAAPTLIPARS